MPTYRWKDYVDAIVLGQLYSRADMAHMFGVGGSTARYHLERAVNNGALNKQYGWTGKQSGWLYAIPETMPRMDGV